MLSIKNGADAVSLALEACGASRVQSFLLYSSTLLTILFVHAEKLQCYSTSELFGQPHGRLALGLGSLETRQEGLLLDGSLHELEVH